MSGADPDADLRVVLERAVEQESARLLGRLEEPQPWLASARTTLAAVKVAPAQRADSLDRWIEMFERQIDRSEERFDEERERLRAAEARLHRAALLQIEIEHAAKLLGLDLDEVDEREWLEQDKATLYAKLDALRAMLEPPPPKPVDQLGDEGGGA